MITKTIAVSEKSEKKTNMISWILSASLHISVFVLLSVMKIMQPEIIEYEPLLELVDDSPGSLSSLSDNATSSSNLFNPLDQSASLPTASIATPITAPQKTTSFYLSTVMPIIRVERAESHLLATEEITETEQPAPDIDQNIKPIEIDTEPFSENIVQETAELPEIIEPEKLPVVEVAKPLEPITPEKPKEIPDEPVQEAVLPEQTRIERKENEETEDLSDKADKIENDPDLENINNDNNRNNENNNDDLNDRGTGGFGNGLQQGIGNGGQALMLPPNTTDGRVLDNISRISRFNANDFNGTIPAKGSQFEAVFSFEIKADGTLSDIVIENSTGYSGVDRKIATALAEFRFPAATQSSHGSITFIIQYLR